MPANQKYLETNNLQKAARLTAGTIGGYLLSLELHYLLALFIERKTVFDAMRFTFYIVWVTFMFVPYLFKNGWLCWAWYGSAATLSALLLYLYL